MIYPWAENRSKLALAMAENPEGTEEQIKAAYIAKMGRVLEVEKEAEATETKVVKKKK